MMELGGGCEKRNSASLEDTQHFLLALLHVCKVEVGIWQMTFAGSRSASLTGRASLQEEKEVYNISTNL